MSSFIFSLNATVRDFHTVPYSPHRNEAPERSDSHLVKNFNGTKV